MSKPSFANGVRVRPLQRCPCCYFYTIEGIGYDICRICWWEDDGQDDETADEVFGGPNGELSLTQARYNFARIGACDWRHLPNALTPREERRAPGFPFLNVPALEWLPPISSWPSPSTLSFHLPVWELGARWRSTVDAMVEESFTFGGIYETKPRIRDNWMDPRYLRKIEFDPNYPIAEFSLAESSVVAAAWFQRPPEGGAMVRFESVGHLGPRRNEPAISVRTYLTQDRTDNLYRRLIDRLTPIIAVSSPTLWGLPTVSNFPSGFVDSFVHGTAYVAAQIASPAFLGAFQSRFGREKVTATSSGYFLSPTRVDWSDREARAEAYKFYKDRIPELVENL
jgi:hypothetical protein